MSIETIIPQLLNTLVNGRVWENATPDVLPKDANGDFLPFILWTLHGGQDAEYVEQEMGEFRNCRVQLPHTHTLLPFSVLVLPGSYLRLPDCS